MNPGKRRGRFLFLLPPSSSSFDLMEIKKGIGVSPGVVISTAVVLDAEDLLIPKRSVAPSAVAGETRRLNQAVSASIVDLNHLRASVSAEHGGEIAKIFDFHLGVLKDKAILQQFINEIDRKSVV